MAAGMRKLAGHSDSVLCCHAPLSDPDLLATSGQDGRVCLFDLRNKDSVQRFECFGNEAVSSVCFTLETCDILYAAAGALVYCIDIRSGSSKEVLMQYSYNTEEINQVLFTCVPASWIYPDFEILWRIFPPLLTRAFTFNASLFCVFMCKVSLNQKATYLAAADDSGEIKVIDLHSHKLLKTLRNIHNNICSAVQFHTHRPWELLSGGLDAKLVKWDFSKGRPVKVIDQGTGETQSGSSEPFCNPPFVHALATPEGQVSREAGKVIAVGKGNGTVEIWDLSLDMAHELHPGGKILRHLTRRRDKTFQQNLEPPSGADGPVEGRHLSAVSSVTFARFSQSGSLVISGSNDRTVKLWNWCEAASSSGSTSTSSGCLLSTIDHKKKVNWLCTAARSSEHVFVADTTKKLTVYTLT